MSPENIDFVRSLFAAWERGDFTATDWAHPEIEFVIADGPAAGSWTGLAGMARGFREITSPMEQFRLEADDYRELDDERVLVLTRSLGRGKMSGLELARMEAKASALFHIRNRKVARLVIYGNREQALADLGLS
jgi:ketosteroid isomerase-like protein